MSKRKGRKKVNSQFVKFLKDKSTKSIKESDIGQRCKLNFSYMDSSQKDAYSFPELFEEGLILEYVEFLIGFCKESLETWKGQGAFTNYDGYPPGSQFSPPPMVPTDVQWARVTVRGKLKIGGFVVPNRSADKDGNQLDANTFYIVFLDPHHKFWPSGKRHT